MRVDALVNATAEQGFILWRDGDNVRFRGNIEMPPEQIEVLREQKRELLAYLKLRDIAGEMDWQLSDLLDWYKDDLADVASMDLATVRWVVRHYIENLDRCRSEGFKLPSDAHPELAPVKCADCKHFIPDDVGYGGIGDCTENIEHSTPLYPNAMRKCATYQTIQLQPWRVKQ